MERTNFQERLKELVVKADQETSRPSNKERVWSNVQTKRKNSTFWYIAVAAVIILGFSFVLLFNQKQLLIPTTNEQTAKGVQKAAPVQDAIEMPKSTLSIIRTQQKISRANVKIDTIQKVTEEKQLMVTEKEQIIAAINPINTERQTPNIQPEPPANNVSTINNPTIEPTFTVQFKRGAVTTVKNEGLLTPMISLKKFRLKRDTSYFANAEEKQPNKMKLRFKKEN